MRKDASLLLKRRIHVFNYITQATREGRMLKVAVAELHDSIFLSERTILEDFAMVNKSTAKTVTINVKQ
jgi:hypothetical protein